MKAETNHRHPLHILCVDDNTELVELVAEVLAENAPMLKVFKKSGLDLSTKRESGVVHVTLRLV